jgi:hypothetical protein
MEPELQVLTLTEHPAEDGDRESVYLAGFYTDPKMLDAHVDEFYMEHGFVMSTDARASATQQVRVCLDGKKRFLYGWTVEVKVVQPNTYKRRGW